MKLSFFSLILVFFYRLFCSKDVGKILQFRFCKQFPLSIILFILQKICFQFYFWDLVAFIFSFFSSKFVLCFDSKKQLGLLHIWPIHKSRQLRIIYLKNTKLTKIIVKAQINPIIRILIKTMDLFIIIVQ